MDVLSAKIENYLNEFCLNIGNRHVGSPGNKQATDFFEKTIKQFGFDTQCPEFDCFHWEFGQAHLKAGDDTFKTLVGPYSLPYNSTENLVPISSIEELQNAEISGKIILFWGEIAQEQLMPKNFVFYNPDHHQKIYRILEEKQPAAIISATGRNPQLAGGWYPFPLFEDGDFDIPNAYIKDVDGEKLRKYGGKDVSLKIESRRIPSKSCNVIAQKGSQSAKKIVFCAHIDAKITTPGALDNATGVATLLGLAELLADYDGKTCIEIIAFNGEDYYAVPGEMDYLNVNQHTLRNINFVVNLDAAGYYKANTAYSFYECSDELKGKMEKILGKYKGMILGDSWPQSDHMIFAMNGCPSVAITSENLSWLSTNITHTDKDTLDIADCHKLAVIAFALKDMALKFGS